MAERTELSEADPCVVCGTTRGYIRPGASTPSRVRGACSSCYRRLLKLGRQDELERTRVDARSFLRRVLNGDVEPDEGGCILWPGSTRNGYATVNRSGQVRQVTHVVLERFVGPRPTEQHAAAHAPHDVCGHTTCVNISHLRWATHEENQADKIRDGTTNRGERHGSAKLTRSQVQQIRDLHATTDTTYAETAARFGVADETIRRIVVGETWTHLLTGSAS